MKQWFRGGFSFMIFKDKNYTDIIWSYSSNGQEYNRFAIEFWIFFDYDNDLFYDTFEIRDELSASLLIHLLTSIKFAIGQMRQNILLLFLIAHVTEYLLG